MSTISHFALWGSAGHAKVLASLIAAQGGRVVALFDNREVASALPDVRLYVGTQGFASWAAQRDPMVPVAGFAAIGGSRGRDRLEIQELFAASGLTQAVLIHPQASVCRTASLGAGTQVLAQAVVAAEARLGRACIVNHGAGVDHECVLGDGVHVAPGATLCGCIHVGNNVFIGAGATVLPRITIGADATVGAGAVVTKNVPAGAVVVGNPACLRPAKELS